MGYSRNFGFRSFENIVRDGRSRIPRDSEDLWVLGTAVAVDTDTQGLVRKPEAGEAPSPACGVLVYEHIQYKGDDPYLVNPSDKDTVAPGEMVQIVRGNGVKIWLKNNEDRPLYDGRSVAGRAMILEESVPASGNYDQAMADISTALGEYLTPTADGFWRVGDAATGWLWVEQVDADSGLVEARLTF